MMITFKFFIWKVLSFKYQQDWSKISACKSPEFKITKAKFGFTMITIHPFQETALREALCIQCRRDDQSAPRNLLTMGYCFWSELMWRWKHGWQLEYGKGFHYVGILLYWIFSNTLKHFPKNIKIEEKFKADDNRAPMTALSGKGLTEMVHGGCPAP